MVLRYTLSLITILACIVGGNSKQYEGCIGEYGSGCCSPDQYDLCTNDTLVLRSTAYTTDYYETYSQSCREKQVIVRRNHLEDDDCQGCTLSVLFQSSSLTPGSQITLYYGKYYILQQPQLTRMVSYNHLHRPPRQITTTGNLLKIVIHRNVSFTLLITPNFPNTKTDRRYTSGTRPQTTHRSTTPYFYYSYNQDSDIDSFNNHDSDSGLALTLGITIPLSMLVTLLCGCLKYQVRKRQARRLRDQVNRAIVAAAVRRTIADQRNRAVRAAITTVVLERLSEEGNQPRRFSPHSPDPNDSMAPPAYSEAVPPPPSYSEVVAQSARGNVESGPASRAATTLSGLANPLPSAQSEQISSTPSDMEPHVPAGDGDVELEDMAGPDTSNDVDRLIV